ncbi:MAG: hypothetical protein ABGW97_11335 [Christiangramia sp.]|uniref:hypothetical protein n=1 Tax=Christiangramia sp. TaxID=1931228 RepID=UPI0032424809
MKKKLEAELKKLAESILNAQGTSNLADMKQRARELYEKIAILEFTENNLEAQFENQVSPQKPEPVKQEPVAPVRKPEPEYDERYPNGMEFNEDTDAITEPNTEKIKDIVAQMPPETAKVDTMMNKMNEPEPAPTREIPKQEPTPEPDRGFNFDVDYDNLPNFEPVNHVEKHQQSKPRSLNDRLKKGINIGLNERLAFIRHLFDGNTADYNRVLSQLNTFNSLEEARKFIDKIVKPDYNHWQGKEEYEERFMAHIENKFD